MASNPNFPHALDIKPSRGSGALEHDERFNIAAQQHAINTYGIAGRVWEASYAMLLYVDHLGHDDRLEFDPPPFTEISSKACAEPLTIIELGSGTGLVASRIAGHLQSGRDILVATDLPDVCPLLESNLQKCPTARVIPLAWGNTADVQSLASYLWTQLSSLRDVKEIRRPTHIVCSDLVYFPELLAPLLRTLLHLTSPPFVTAASETPQIVMSYKIRSLAKETPFWSAFGLWFSFSTLLARRIPDSGSGSEDEGWMRYPSELEDDEVFIFIARRREESSSWMIPENDRDLMRGVGAGGTPTSKSDESFETMLLMSIDTLDREK